MAAIPPPGWYNYQVQGVMRWWDGSGWSDPSADSRLRPGEPTSIDSVVLEFAADPSWPPPPSNWYRIPMWQPEQGWQAPVDDLWRAVGPDDETYLAELSHAVTILEEEALAKDVWRLDSREAIPLVPVAPPNRPNPAIGWSSLARWKAPRGWGRAPKDWQSWQPDPTLIARRTAAIHAKADQRSRALARSTIGIALLLSDAEALLCDVVRLTPLALSPLPSAARNGFPISASTQLTEALWAAHEGVVRSVSNLRTYLLRVAYGVGQPDAWLWQLRRALSEARDAYQLAAKAAAAGVFSATVEHVRSEVSRLKPRHTRRRQQLSAALAELSQDVEDRAEALSSQRGRSPSESAALPRAGAPVWELAEELAAEHLRSLGFRDALRTPAGSDGGFDVEGRGVVAQVKYRTSVVGRPDIQRLIGANQHGARPVFYARAGYSQSAIDFARQTGVALFALDATTSQVNPVNDAATMLSADA